MIRPARLLPALLLCLPAFATARAARPEPSAASERPDPASVQRFGPAYRYPRAGWVVLHIEGAPYDRGYQHGRLMAPEITDYVKTLAGRRSAKAPADAWRETRTLVNALFLRTYDAEYLDEMKGIADGAAAAGAKFDGRPLDLLDLVTVNSDIELEFLDSALEATPTGLEGKTFRAPADRGPSAAPPEHCSAFAATGPATADGKVVIGHITMFSLAFVRHFNVWLDVKPADGRRVLMQTYPGGIQSGMDYYMNDAGLVVLETTIKQTRFEATGKALASRIRKALQYSDSIDQAVATLRAGNNGMYTNEWLLADTKTNEIAMFELGTAKDKLWRSSRDEWFGGTKGFYWGCNNAKDLDVRMETVAAADGRPANLVWRPTDRDKLWQSLYRKHSGKIDAGFGFEAFTTPPLAAFSSCDAKFTTTDLARDLKTWALFGPPLGRTWDPTDADRRRGPDAQPLIPNDWTVLSAEAVPDTTRNAIALRRVSAITADGMARTAPEPDQSKKAEAKPRPDEPKPAVDLAPAKDDESDDEDDAHTRAAWHGTLLPKTEADTWLAAAFADYEPIVARGLARRDTAREAHRELNAKETQAEALDLFEPFSKYRTAVARLGKDRPLAETTADLTRDEWYEIAAGKGTLLLAALRRDLGDPAFLKFMDDFGRAHAGKAVAAADFRDAALALPGHDLHAFFQTWTTQTGLPAGAPTGPGWAVDSFEQGLGRTVIVYGTLKESDAQREAAGRLQRQIQRNWSNITVPILADREATPEAVKGKHVLLIGRPDTNASAAELAREIPVVFGPASFMADGSTYAHALSAVIAAGPNPTDPTCEVVIFAGLSAEATWRCVEADAGRSRPAAEVVVLPARRRARRLVVDRDPTAPVRSVAR